MKKEFRHYRSALLQRDAQKNTYNVHTVVKNDQKTDQIRMMTRVFLFSLSLDVDVRVSLFYQQLKLSMKPKVN